MGKGEVTRERIIEQTAPLFNQMGFFGSSLTDIMKATGLKKGGIYNHFGSKEELALEAFDHAAACVSARIAARVGEETGAVERLVAFAEVFRQNFVDPPIKGGCPLMNTAIESDDAHPALRERAQAAMDRWRKRIGDAVADGIATGELRPHLDADVVATRLIATLEGGTMLSRLYGDPVHVHRAIDFAIDYVRRDLAA